MGDILTDSNTIIGYRINVKNAENQEVSELVLELSYKVQNFWASVIKKLLYLCSITSPRGM